MEFLQPWMLWGLAGVIIPVAVHFWYQKRAEVIEWAASRWLSEKNLLKQKGIRLHEIPLMLIRCLLVILLALILSQPVLNWWKERAAESTIHVVEPNAAVVNTYRFELENALKAKEQVVWMNAAGPAVKDLTDIPAVTDPEIYLQSVINQMQTAGARFNIYLNANQKLLNLPKIYVPGPVSVYPVSDRVNNKMLSYIVARDGKKLAVDPDSRLLMKMIAAPPGYRFANAPAHSGPFHMLVDFRDRVESETVLAALGALRDVYDIPFEIDQKADPEKKYAWIFSDKMPSKISAEPVYILSGLSEPVQHSSNIHYLPDSLKIANSELVRSGRLPEYLGGLCVALTGLNQEYAALSDQQVRRLFIQTKPLNNPAGSKLHSVILLLFVLLTMLERWLALRKGGFGYDGKAA